MDDDFDPNRYVECPECSRASTSDRPVYHELPLCQSERSYLKLYMLVAEAWLLVDEESHDFAAATDEIVGLWNRLTVAEQMTVVENHPTLAYPYMADDDEE